MLITDSSDKSRPAQWQPARRLNPKSHVPALPSERKVKLSRLRSSYVLQARRTLVLGWNKPLRSQFCRRSGGAAKRPVKMSQTMLPAGRVCE